MHGVNRRRTFETQLDTETAQRQIRAGEVLYGPDDYYSAQNPMLRNQQPPRPATHFTIDTERGRKTVTANALLLGRVEALEAASATTDALRGLWHTVTDGPTRDAPPLGQGEIYDHAE